MADGGGVEGGGHVGVEAQHGEAHLDGHGVVHPVGILVDPEAEALGRGLQSGGVDAEEGEVEVGADAAQQLVVDGVPALLLGGDEDVGAQLVEGGTDGAVAVQGVVGGGGDGDGAPVDVGLAGADVDAGGGALVGQVGAIQLADRAVVVVVALVVEGAVGVVLVVVGTPLGEVDVVLCEEAGDTGVGGVGVLGALEQGVALHALVVVIQYLFI